MKKILTILFFVIQVQMQMAQMIDSIPKWRMDQINRVVEAIKFDKVDELADMIIYPLRRPNPIPDIMDKESFVLYYNILFDSEIKRKITCAEFTSKNTLDSYGTLILFNGMLILNSTGQITQIEFISNKEKALKKRIDEKEISSFQKRLQNVKRNIIKCDCNGQRIRIDVLTDNSLRLISWLKETSYGQKPDIVIKKGDIAKAEFGGVQYVFKKKNLVYTIIRDFEVSKIYGGLAIILKIKVDDTINQTIECKEIK